MRLVFVFLMLSAEAFGQVATPLTVYPGSGTAPAEVRLRERRSNGDNWVAVKAPAAVTTDVTWVLPSVDGTLGQALVTDGAGTLSWSSVAGNTMPVCTSTNGTDAYTCTVSGFTSYSSGYCIILNPDVANTGAATVNISGVGAQNILQYGGSALVTNDILASTPLLICYNGTDFLLPPSGTTGAGAFLNGGNSFGANAALGTNDNYDLLFERNSTTLLTLGAGGIDMAPAVTNFYTKVRKLEIADAALGSAFWDVTASASSGSSEYRTRDNAGSRWIVGYRTFSGSPANYTHVFTDWLPAKRDTTDGDALTDAAFPSLGSTGRRWLKLWADSAELTNGLTVGTTASFGGNVVMSGTTNTMSGTMRPGFTNIGSIGDASYRYATIYAVDLDLSGTCTGCGGGGWTISGSDIYRTTGNVGIGTSTPGQKLTVTGTASISGVTGIGETAPSKGLLSVYGSNGFAYTPFNQVAAARFRTGANSAILLGTTIANTSGWTRGIYWSYQLEDFALTRFKDDESAVPVTDFYITSAGLVGIGTTSPSEKLTVSGNLSVSGTSAASGFNTTGGSYSVGGTPVISNSRELGNINYVATNLIPSSTTTYNLGSSTYRWNNLWAQAFDFASGGTIGGNVVMSGTTNTMSGIMRPGFDGLGSIGTSSLKYGAVYAYDVVAASNLWVSSSVVINSSRNLVGLNAVNQTLLFTPDNAYDIGSSGASRPRNLFVAGSGTFGGTVTGGAFNTASGGGYSVNGTLVISSGRELGNITYVAVDLNPSLTTTYSLGNTTYRWNKLWAQDFDFSGGGTFTGNVVMSGTTNTMSGTMRPGFDGLGSIGNSAYKYGALYTYNAYFYGTVQAPNGFAGQSTTITVRDSAGTGTCTIIFSGGLKTGGTC